MPRLLSRLVLTVTIAIVCLSSASAAPSAEEVTVAKENESNPVSDLQRKWEDWNWLDNTFFSTKRSNVVAESIVGMFILTGIGLALYYYYYLNYYGNDTLDPQSYGGYPASAYNYYGKSAGRALEGTQGSFSFARILDMIAMAQETYENFDIQNVQCPKKALCELQHKKNGFGDAGRTIASTFLYADVFEGLPLPRTIKSYLKEYKDAVIQGNNSSRDCTASYPDCAFSIKEVFVKYSKKIQQEQSPT